MDFEAQLEIFRQRIEAGIDTLLPLAGERPRRLHEAMRYSVGAGGKRIRPVLCLAVADLLLSRADALPAAVALECVHTYSLIHDDLPCMDDGLLRRGRPTCHRQFDEATALLAGDGLLTHAFHLLARHYRETPKLAAELALELSTAAGSSRLIGGQMEDIENENNPEMTTGQLGWINENKTAALLSAALVAGGIVAEAEDATLARLRDLGRHAGLAFQVIDDILDVTADAHNLGKTAGADARQEKVTLVSRLGIDRAREKARDHTRAAREICGGLPQAAPFLQALLSELEQRIR